MIQIAVVIMCFYGLEMRDVRYTNLLLLDTNVTVTFPFLIHVMVAHKSVNLKRNMGVLDVKKKNVVQEIVKVMVQIAVVI